MRIVHFSDTHGPKYHSKLNIPDCDILICSGDIGGKTTLLELTEFLYWFNQQPGKLKLWTAGNHDLICDINWVKRKINENKEEFGYLLDEHYKAVEVINNYSSIYLNEKGYQYNGLKIFGSPYSTSFNRDKWAFNADPGNEINKHWAKIPSDVDILITHTPVYGILDYVPSKELKKGEEDNNRGCKDLLNVMKKRLIKLQLHCSGHIHDNVGVVYKKISNTRRVLFSNGAVVSNKGEQLIKEPFIINI